MDLEREIYNFINKNLNQILKTDSDINISRIARRFKIDENIARKNYRRWKDEYLVEGSGIELFEVKKDIKKLYWTKDEEAYLIKNFGKLDISVLEEVLGRNRNSIYAKARRMKINFKKEKDLIVGNVTYVAWH
ncbi:MAG: hypothetical protein ACRCW0_00285 [Clostridium sp.]